MKMSRIGLKVNKQRGTNETLGQEILFQTGQLKRNTAGIYSIGHFLLKSRNKIINIIKEVLDKYECCEVVLPTLQPQNLWEESGRWEKFVESNSMFHFEGKNNIYCLAPTAEEISISYMKDILISYKNLPVNIYQISNKYRDEIRVRGGLLRSKEFLMKDGYSFHSNFESLEIEYEKMKQCYLEIFERLKLEVIPVKALNSDMGGKVSEEFMMIADYGEDKLLLSKDHKLAFNIEFLEENTEYPNLDFNSFEKKSCIELGHIFQLGDFYSKSMSAYFINENNQKVPFIMGCYGLGINRILGALYEKFATNEGIRLPNNIAPYSCVIVSQPDLNSDSHKLYLELKNKNIDVLLDDRDINFGYKLKESKLLGISNIILLGNNYKKNNLFELESNLTDKRLFLTKKELLDTLTQM